MKNYLPAFILSLLLLSNTAFAQYNPSSAYLQNPELAIGYADSCAQFWLQTWDDQSGGFYTNIDKDGTVLTSWGTNKNMLTQSRNAYGMTRAFMLTGDTTYLGFAKRSLDWMYKHAWDTLYGGWYQELDINGNPVDRFANKTAFYQHYALLGIAAFYEATGDTTAWHWLLKGYQHLENIYWDNRTGYTGYLDESNYGNDSAWNKSFNATVDAVTTHLLSLYYITKEQVYKDRLIEMAEEIEQHLVASMPQQAIGFVEKFNTDWEWRDNETLTLMGHVLKSGWCLARINRLHPDISYINNAEILIDDVYQNGYDHEFGGPYKDYNRVTGEMILWGLQDSAKAWWQMEQAITAGLQMFDLTGEDWYLQMADETIQFYMQHFVDPVYGEVYADRTRYGGIAWNEAKGNSGKAAYHSIETGFYTYLYGNIFLKKEPVVLHYNFEPRPENRNLNLTPFAIEDARLNISNVLLDGMQYSGYDPVNRILSLPSGIGGQFEITYEPVITSIDTEPVIAVNDFHLYQNYPNPFNPSTKIKYQIKAVGTHDRVAVQLKVYDILGNEIATLVDEQKSPGTYEVEFNTENLSAGRQALASGIYFYRIETANFVQTRKMILLQ